MKLYPAISRPTARRGFSFTEVLFAVMILGIGFIMVAAIFPVAIQQTQNNTSEGTAASIARGAVATIQQSLRDADIPKMPVPLVAGTPPQPGRARVYSFRNPQTTKGGDPQFPAFDKNTWPGTQAQPPEEQLWNRIKGNLILSNDPRYGWVGFFRREGSSPYVQIYVIVTQARANPIYTPARDLVPLRSAASPPIANLQARPLQVKIIGNRLQVIGGVGGPAVAEGCYVIIANDNLKAIKGNNQSIPDSARVGWMNGRIYRVANSAGGGFWELMPGSDFAPDAGPDGQFNTPDDINALDQNADAFVVGKTFLGANATVPFEGPAQDIAVYTTFVQLR